MSMLYVFVSDNKDVKITLVIDDQSLARPHKAFDPCFQTIPEERFAARAPLAVVPICVLCILLGAIAFERLPIDLMPDIEIPRISVNTNYDGAAPEEVEQLITRPSSHFARVLGLIIASF